MQNKFSTKQVFRVDAIKTSVKQLLRNCWVIVIFICLLNAGFAKADSRSVFNQASINDSIGGGTCEATFKYTVSAVYTVQFTSTSYSYDTIARYHWDFGDGDTSNSQNPIHTYASSAYFGVCLTIYSDSGCSSQTCTTIAIGPKTGCQAYYSYDVISDETTQFISNSSTKDSVAFYHWEFGDGDTSDLKSPVHTYATYGNYNVCLYIISAGGCTSNICEDSVRVGTCTAGFSYSYATRSTINFSGHPYTPDTVTSYTWSFGDGATNTTSLSPSHGYTANGNYEVIFTMYASNGCSAADTGYVKVPVAICQPSFTYTTLGDTVYLTNTSIGNGTLSYRWFFGYTSDTSDLINPVFIDSGGVKDTSGACLTMVSDSGCSAYYCSPIVFGNVVWPGDANDDLTVDNNDLITIGLYYGETGTARDTVTNTWAPHPSANWNALEVNGKDKKYADCNGDGKINSDDTLAITLNYGRMHPDDSPRRSRSTNGTVPLTIIADSTSYHAGSLVHASVMLGNSTNTASDIYGLAYTITIDNVIVKPGTLAFTYDNSSFLGVKNSNVLVFTHIVNDVETAVTGIDHTNRTGYGKIGDLYFVMTSNSTQAQQALSISAYQAVDNGGNQKVLLPVNDTVIVPTGIQTMPNILGNVGEIYPNPTANIASLQVQLHNNASLILSVKNLLGQEVYNNAQNLSAGNTVLTIPTAALSSGVYFVELRANDAAAIVRKLIKE